MTSSTATRTSGLYKKRRRDVVYDRLFHAVTAAESYAGQRLAPIKDMAARFGTSIRTVQIALDQLEQEGYIQRRRGAGTFICSRAASPSRSSGQVAVAMPARHNEVWTALSASIVRELHAAGCIPVIIDMDHRDAVSLLHRAAEGSVGTFIIRGGRGFPFHLFEQPAFRDKQVIAVEEWASMVTTPQMHQVLDDYAYGGQQVADHFFKAGHRRALIVAAVSSLERLNRRDGIACGASRGHAFIDYWTAVGGTWKTLPIYRTSETLSGFDLDLSALIAELTSAEPVTAVFGYRDVEAWTVQSLLQRHRPDLLERVEIVGYGDTSWSRAIQPALSTVAYPLEDIAQWVRRLIDEIAAAQASGNCVAPQRVMVRPQLIDRSRRSLHVQQQQQPAPDLHHGATAKAPSC